jgi:hypothetical protein
MLCICTLAASYSLRIAYSRGVGPPLLIFASNENRATVVTHIIALAFLDFSLDLPESVPNVPCKETGTKLKSDK